MDAQGVNLVQRLTALFRLGLGVYELAVGHRLNSLTANPR